MTNNGEIYLVETITENNSSYVIEFRRKSPTEQFINKIKWFKPYFFVDDECPITSEIDGILTITKGEYYSITGKKLKKVVVTNVYDIQKITSHIERLGFEHWEADIKPHNRYLFDSSGELNAPQLKVCWIDIETAAVDENNTDFPDIETADQKIVCISTKIGDDLKTWLLSETPINGATVFNEEEALLKDFIEYIRKESPDILSGWNINGFDLPYIINRCSRLGVDYKWLSKIRKIEYKKKDDKYYIKLYGTVVFDLLDKYKLWRKYGNLPLLSSYSLNHVAKVVLGKTKTEIDKSITWLWHNNKKLLVEYNKNDTQLLDEIDKECEIIDFFDSLRRRCRIQFEDTTKSTAIIDGYMISRLKHKVILPSLHYSSGDKFEGAFVYEPAPGIYENVLCLDIHSMYPSIIKNYNISPETFGGGEIQLPLEGGISYSKKQGIIPRLLDELQDERTRFKKLRNNYPKSSSKWKLYDQRQFATKIILNTFFGILGFPGSRLYKREVAMSITGMGQYIIKFIIRLVEEVGNKITYSDTDSVYLLSTETNKYKVIMEGMKLTEYINKKLEELNMELAGRNDIYIEFEKALKKVLFTDAKKRYAYILLWDSDVKFNVDDKIHIQGFDQKRSDNSELSKQIQLTVIEMILAGKTKQEVVGYLKNEYHNMVNGKYSPEYIGFPKGITKPLEEYNPPPAIIKGAIYSNKHYGTQFGKASKPKFVYIKTINGKEEYITIHGKEYKLESLAFEETIPDNVVIDWDTMAEKTFKNKLIKLFDAMGWEWEELNTVDLFSFV